jgi:hypothetical protein
MSLRAKRGNLVAFALAQLQYDEIASCLAMTWSLIFYFTNYQTKDLSLYSSLIFTLNRFIGPNSDS